MHGVPEIPPERLTIEPEVYVVLFHARTTGYGSATGGTVMVIISSYYFTKK